MFQSHPCLFYTPILQSLWSMVVVNILCILSMAMQILKYKDINSYYLSFSWIKGS